MLISLGSLLRLSSLQVVPSSISSSSASPSLSSSRSWRRNMVGVAMAAVNVVSDLRENK